MATFVINVPIETTEATIQVDIPPGAPLRVGPHRFQLVVVDDSGNLSQADTVIVRVLDGDAPTAVLAAPDSVNFNTAFTLDGGDSSDVGGGRVVRFIWTYLGPERIIVGPGPIGPVLPDRPA